MQDELDQAAIVRATTSKWSTMKDGTLRLELHVEPCFARKAIEMLTTEPGIHVAVARLNDA